MIGTAKIEPLIKKKDNEDYFTHISIDEDALVKDTSSFVMTTNYNLNIEFQIDSKDLYQLALLIVNKFNDEFNS